MVINCLGVFLLYVAKMFCLYRIEAVTFSDVFRVPFLGRVLRDTVRDSEVFSPP